MVRVRLQGRFTSSRIRKGLPIGTFGEALEQESGAPTRPTLWTAVADAMNKDSLEELKNALQEPSYSAVAISRAILTSTGIEVSETTIRQWRRGERST